MENTNTHKFCSVRIEYMQIKQFEFLVPNKCVNENGEIDSQITQEITEKFRMRELTYADCEGWEMHNEAEVPFSCPFQVEKDCGDEDLEMSCLPIFCNDE